METRKEICFNAFGLYEGQLFYALPGYFASNAWRENDPHYEDILGQKFLAICQDGIYMLPRQKLARVSEENAALLWERSSELFKLLVNIYEFEVSGVSTEVYQDWAFFVIVCNEALRQHGYDWVKNYLEETFNYVSTQV